MIRKGSHVEIRSHGHIITGVVKSVNAKLGTCVVECTGGTIWRGRITELVRVA